MRDVRLAERIRSRQGGVQINVDQERDQSVSRSAFEYLRNTVFDAADFFTNKLRAKKNDLKRNQFGGTWRTGLQRQDIFFPLLRRGFRKRLTVSSTRVPTAAGALPSPIRFQGAS